MTQDAVSTQIHLMHYTRTEICRKTAQALNTTGLNELRKKEIATVHLQSAGLMMKEAWHRRQLDSYQWSCQCTVSGPVSVPSVVLSVYHQWSYQCTISGPVSVPSVVLSVYRQWSHQCTISGPVSGTISGPISGVISGPIGGVNSGSISVCW